MKEEEDKEKAHHSMTFGVEWVGEGVTASVNIQFVFLSFEAETGKAEEKIPCIRSMIAQSPNRSKHYTFFVFIFPLLSVASDINVVLVQSWWLPPRSNFSLFVLTDNFILCLY